MSSRGANVRTRGAAVAGPQGAAAAADASKKRKRSSSGDRPLIKSSKNSTGFKGLQLDKGRFKSKCDTPPCQFNHLGTFDTAEEAAEAYLEHIEEEHPEKLEKEWAQPLKVQEHLLIRSDTNSSGLKGVVACQGRYQATCSTAACKQHHLGRYDTREEAGQAYLQHHQEEHAGSLNQSKAAKAVAEEVKNAEGKKKKAKEKKATEAERKEGTAEAEAEAEGTPLPPEPPVVAEAQPLALDVLMQVAQSLSGDP